MTRMNQASRKKGTDETERRQNCVVFAQQPPYSLKTHTQRPNVILSERTSASGPFDLSLSLGTCLQGGFKEEAKGCGRSCRRSPKLMARNQVRVKETQA